MPEISPDLAKEAGALAVATGRCDYPNQVNNSLAFPGVFRGALDVKARAVNDEMKIAAAHAIAELVDRGRADADYLIPDSLDLRVAPRVAAAVAEAAIETGVARASPSTRASRSALPRPRLRRHDRPLDLLSTGKRA